LTTLLVVARTALEPDGGADADPDGDQGLGAVPTGLEAR